MWKKSSNYRHTSGYYRNERRVRLPYGGVEQSKILHALRKAQKWYSFGKRVTRNPCPAAFRKRAGDTKVQVRATIGTWHRVSSYSRQPSLPESRIPREANIKGTSPGISSRRENKQKPEYFITYLKAIQLYIDDRSIAIHAAARKPHTFHNYNSLRTVRPQLISLCNIHTISRLALALTLNSILKGSTLTLDGRGRRGDPRDPRSPTSHYRPSPHYPRSSHPASYYSHHLRYSNSSERNADRSF